MDFLNLKLIINSILKNDEEARSAFNREIDLVIDNVKKEQSRKSFNSFLMGSIVSAVIYAVVIIKMKGGL